VITRALIPDDFDLLDEDGNKAPAMICPFCHRRLTIGFVALSNGERDTVPAAIHDGPRGDARTGCEVFDRLELLPFLALTLPILDRRAALALVSRPKGAPS